MYVTWQTVVAFISLLSALGALLVGILKVHKWYLEQQSLKKELEDIKEDTLICFALSACLDGLLQLGAKHTVPVAKEKLDKFLNKREERKSNEHNYNYFYMLACDSLYRCLDFVSNF